MRFQYNFICLVLYLQFFLLCQWWIMSYIKMSIILCLLSTVLPNMRTQYSSCSRIDDMSTSMECSKCVSSLDINATMNWCSHQFLIKHVSNKMQEAMTHFLNIVNLILFFLNFYVAKIMNLTTRCRIESTFIKNQHIFTSIFLLCIIQNSYNCCIELRQSMIFVV